MKPDTKSSTSTALQPKSVAEPTAISVPDDLRALLETASRETPAGSRDVMMTPFLRIAQAMSPQLKRTEAAHIPGLEEGDIFEVVSGRYWKANEGVTVIPCAYEHVCTRWRVREEGGGFLSEEPFGPNHKANLDWLLALPRDQKKRRRDETGAQVTTAFKYYVLIVERDGTVTPAVVAMTGAEERVARRWNTLLHTQQAVIEGAGRMRAPFFWRSFILTTSDRRNEEGTWKGWTVTPGTLTLMLPDGQALLTQAHQFARAVQAGEVMATTASAEPDDIGVMSQAENDDLPF